MDVSAVSWGILGTGRIAHDFTQCLNMMGQRIVACAARDALRSLEFKKKFGIERSYSSYDELVEDKDVDIVYINTINRFHVQHAKLCLNAGKHVVLEKPMAPSLQEADEVIQLAHDKGLFFLEGMWTRFFPAVRLVKEILESEELGKCMAIYSDFGFDDRKNKAIFTRQSGGAMMDVGVYNFAHILLGFAPRNGTYVTDVRGLAIVDKTGIDVEASLTLQFQRRIRNAENEECNDADSTDEDTRLLAHSHYSLRTRTPEEVRYICEQGFIIIKSPAHCPERVIVSRAGSTSNADDRSKADDEEEYHFPLPDTDYAFTFPNSQGFVYEIDAVVKALDKGVQQCEEYSWDESRRVCELMDKAREAKIIP